MGYSLCYFFDEIGLQAAFIAPALPGGVPAAPVSTSQEGEIARTMGYSHCYFFDEIGLQAAFIAPALPGGVPAAPVSRSQEGEI
jgi:hypothetical protein